MPAYRENLITSSSVSLVRLLIPRFSTADCPSNRSGPVIE